MTRRVEPVHHLDQGRLACPVVADKSYDLPALDLEGDPLDGDEIPEIHGDVAKGENALTRRAVGHDFRITPNLAPRPAIR
jgi:hypothetical protein